MRATPAQRRDCRSSATLVDSVRVVGDLVLFELVPRDDTGTPLDFATRDADTGDLVDASEAETGRGPQAQAAEPSAAGRSARRRLMPAPRVHGGSRSATDGMAPEPCRRRAAADAAHGCRTSPRFDEGSRRAGRWTRSAALTDKDRFAEFTTRNVARSFSSTRWCRRRGTDFVFGAVAHLARPRGDACAGERHSNPPGAVSGDYPPLGRGQACLSATSPRRAVPRRPPPRREGRRRVTWWTETPSRRPTAAHGRPTSCSGPGPSGAGRSASHGVRAWVATTSVRGSPRQGAT